MTDGPAVPEPVSFRGELAVEQLDDARWHVDVSPRWEVLGGAPNGGYLTSLVVRAVTEATPGHPDPATITTHYLRPATPGPAEVTVDVVATGRRFSRFRASLLQGGRRVVELLGATCDLDALDGPSMATARPPTLPDRGECVDPNHGLGLPASSIRQRLDVRVPVDADPWAMRGPDGTGSLAAWVRWAGAEPMTPLGLLTLVDAMPPAVFHLGAGVGWTPTVELTTQVRRRPVPGWLRILWCTRAVTNGLLEEDAEVWDADDNLVALSRQLALASSSDDAPAPPDGGNSSPGGGNSSPGGGNSSPGGGNSSPGGGNS